MKKYINYSFNFANYNYQNYLLNYLNFISFLIKIKKYYSLLNMMMVNQFLKDRNFFKIINIILLIIFINLFKITPLITI